MSATRSTAAERAKKYSAARSDLKLPELIAMLGASFTVLIGLLLVFWAKTSIPIDAATSQGDKLPLNLNTLANPEQLLPYLTIFTNASDRDFVAKKIYDSLKGDATGAPNVGALAKLTVTESEITSNPKLEIYSTRLQEQKKRLEEEHKKRAAQGEQPQAKEMTLSLFTPRQFSQLKPAFIVRSPGQFRSRLLFWGLLYFAAFYAVYLVLWARRFSGDGLLLPAAHLLTGIGLMLMISIRDPLRDRTDFVEFAEGVAIGCVVMLALSLLDCARLQRLAYIPLIAGLLLSIALILFGSGPTGSDAKVNLLGTQPVEAIKILAVFFLAGFFADRWLGLRALSAKPSQSPGLLRLFELPRAKDSIPVIVGMGVVLFFFFLQKDLGPALILACTFLVLYAVARLRLFMIGVGLGMVIAGFWIGYRLGFPRTVSDRIKIWLSPWDNAIGGGIQLVHSFWAMATGSLTGTGIGLGDAEIVPAVHTDLILAAVGEELGFVGLLVVFTLYALIIWRGLRIALRSSGDYTFFLALGLTSLTALQIFLISGGILGIVPLSGVVSPFLSFGKSSAIANFAIIGILLGISARPGEAMQQKELKQNFGASAKWAGAVFAALAAVVLAKAAYLQVIRGDQTLIAGTLTLQGDGKLRYQYNPRLEMVARQIPKGSVYDRNNIPLATSSWEELEQHRRQYEQLGIEIDAVCSKQDERHYPFGGLTFHLLGDRRTRVNWAARNTSYLERDSSNRLIGYDDNAKIVEVRRPNGEANLAIQRDYTELIPLLRYRYLPSHDSVRRILNRERNVRTSIDIALQQRVAATLKDKVRQARKERGAAVVMDADTGDLLAAVSYPWPEDLRLLGAAAEEDDADEGAAGALYDRARWGIYPPGSTFKIVTAIAALSKNPQTIAEKFECRGLGGRQGNYVRGWGRPIYDDESDGASGHGSVNMEQGIVQSCNAYFAQLAVARVGAESMFQTTSQMEIEFTKSEAKAKMMESLRNDLPQAAFGQGIVYTTPFQMARVAATVAGGGKMPFGRWVTDDSNKRTQEPALMLDREQADFLGRAMRGVVLRGTARRLSGSPIPIAGKTGTAENKPGEASHSWFIGFAPYGADARNRIAFSVIVENGGYGGSLAAPIAGEIVAAALGQPAKPASTNITVSNKPSSGGRNGNSR